MTNMSVLAWTSGIGVSRCSRKHQAIILHSLHLLILLNSVSFILRQSPPQYLAEVAISVTLPSSSQLWISEKRECLFCHCSNNSTKEVWPSLDSLPESTWLEVGSRQ